MDCNLNCILLITSFTPNPAGLPLSTLGDNLKLKIAFLAPELTVVPIVFPALNENDKSLSNLPSMITLLPQWLIMAAGDPEIAGELLVKAASSITSGDEGINVNVLAGLPPGCPRLSPVNVVDVFPVYEMYSMTAEPAGNVVASVTRKSPFEGKLLVSKTFSVVSPLLSVLVKNVVLGKELTFVS